MIKKIVKLKNVWKYKNYSVSWWTESDFWSVSLIYWENTYWKSTLTTVFKSLKTKNKDYIYGRKTFWSTDIQEVEILIDWKITKLSDADFWNDNIEIFDNDFVSRNVFYWDEIWKNQQWNLYEIFLDENIKKDRLEIDDLKTKKETLEKDKKEYIFQNYKLPIKIEDFEKIKENLKVDDDIKTKSVELKQVNNIAEIAKLLASNLFLYDFTGLKEAFIKTLDTSIEDSITSHLNENLNDVKNGKNFIATWLGLLKSDNCVFCGQKLDEEALKLIENYRKIFSKTYEDLKNEIKQKGDKFLDIDFGSQLRLELN